VLFLDRDRLGPCKTFGQMNAFFQSLDLPRLGRTCDTDQVGFFYTIARVRKAIGELAIVRDEDQPFARSIEPPDSEYSLFRRNKIDDPSPAAGIVIRRHHADRLIDGKIQPLRLANRFPIDADFLPRWIDARTELGDRLAIDFDTARTDVIFTISPAAEPRGRQHLLEALTARSGVVAWRLWSILGHCRDFRLWFLEFRGVFSGFGITSGFKSLKTKVENLSLPSQFTALAPRRE